MQGSCLIPSQVNTAAPVNKLTAEAARLYINQEAGSSSATWQTPHHALPPLPATHLPHCTAATAVPTCPPDHGQALQYRRRRDSQHSSTSSVPTSRCTSPHFEPWFCVNSPWWVV